MKKRIASLLVLAGVSALPSSHAVECTNRNLETMADNPMQSIPVYDQDGTGLCYAYSASEMMNCFLMKTFGDKKLRVHPATAAIRFTAAHDKAETLNDGFIHHAINATRKRPNYSYTSVSTNLTELARNQGVSEAEVLHFIESLGKAMSNINNQKLASDRAWARANREPNLWERTGKYFSYMPEEVRKAAYESIKPDSWCSKDDLSALRTFALTAPIGSSLDIASNTVFESNHRESALEGPLPLATHLTSMKDAAAVHAEEVRRHFALNATLPLGLSFCSRVIRDPSYVGISGSGASRAIVPAKNNGGKDCGPHAVLISGIRNQGGSCQYLIRNSWGSSFGGSISGRSCVCKNTVTKAFSECPGSGKANGADIPGKANLKVISCWFPESQVTNNTMSIDRLQ